MRLVIIGTDADGRSTVAEVRELFASRPSSGRAHDFLWRTDAGLPTLSTVPDGLEPTATGIPPGGTAWIAVCHAAGSQTELHRTDSLDYGVVIEGSMTLRLERDEVALTAGDAVLMPGVLHSWHAGPDGCTIVITLLGSAPARADVASAQ